MVSAVFISFLNTIMKKTYIFTIVLGLIASIGLMAPLGVFAQYYYGAPYIPAYTTAQPVYATNPGNCFNLTSNLYKGLRDTSVGGQISALQSFLISQRYLSISAPTGYFGALTAQAVARYQSTHGIPSDGTVGVLTRGSINSISCGNNSGNNYNYGYNNYYGAPVANSLSATSGSVGNSVTIYGSGFDLYNNTVNFGGVTIPGIPSYAGTALAFVVPQVNGTYSNYNYYNNNNYNDTVGTYSVSVRTSRGTSNPLQFTVNGYGNNNCYNYYGYNNNNCYNNGTISISNVSGPTTLTTGTVGTWSLTLFNPNSNYVSVSATWGDENTYYRYASSQATESSYVQGQQTISFTHTYQNSGYYTVTFTATDNNGAQTTASATVNVSGTIYSPGLRPTLSSIYPISARVGTRVALRGSGFTPTGNTVHFGSGGMSNVSASNGGNTIYYTIPYSMGPCDLVTSGSQVCAKYLQQVTPGRYSVYVSNAYGQTSTVYFNVTN